MIRTIEASAPSTHGLPYLDACRASIAKANEIVGPARTRRYLADALARRLVFTSPITGCPARVTASAIARDQKVCFLFDEPGFGLVVSDIAGAWPIVAIVCGPDTVIDVYDTPRRPASDEIKMFAALAMAGGPAELQPLTLVVGDPNFAHNAWNQLAAIDAFANNFDYVDEVIITHEPLGPIETAFPELAGKPMQRLAPTQIAALTGTEHLYVPAGSMRLTVSCIERLRNAASARHRREFSALAADVGAIRGPLLWASIRTRNRTATNQIELLAALSGSFLRRFPNSAIILDGHSFPDDFEANPDYAKTADEAIANRDADVAHRVIESVSGRGIETSGRVFVASGLHIADAIELARHAAFYFCHHGTIQHKIGWFASVPGVVHSNRTVIAHEPAAWVAAQSEIAREPLYIPKDFVEDVPDSETGGVDSQAIMHDNYLFTNLDAIVSYIMEAAVLGMDERG